MGLPAAGRVRWRCRLRMRGQKRMPTILKAHLDEEDDGALAETRKVG